MITSFYESYLLLVELCALFCVLVNVYNFARYLSQGFRERRQMKREKLLTVWFQSYAEIAEVLSQREDRWLVKKLRKGFRHGRWLLAADSALRRLMWTRPKTVPERLRRILRDALLHNFRRFEHFDDPARGLVINVSVYSGLESRRLQRYLTDCMKRKPLYLRITALRGCAAQRDEALMLDVLDLVNRQDGDYSTKLLTDILMEYAGDQKRLAEQMWLRLPGYSQALGCAYIGFLTYARNEAFCVRLLELIQNGSEEKELRIAAIKYFGAVPMPEAEPVLARILDEEEWEYAAVAARTLQNYPSGAYGDILVRSLSSRNWHVRYNSAMALVACHPERVEEALHSEDRYARDILRYALDARGVVAV